MRLIGVYDISVERTRRRVAALFSEYGVRVQMSAFELDVTGTEAADIRHRVASLVDPTTDRVALYPVDRAGLRRVVWIGAGPLQSIPEEKPRYFVV